MIKFKVTKQGVYLAAKSGQEEQPVGTILSLDVDEVPSWLVGKGYIVGDSEGKTLVAADSELLNTAMAENADLSSQLAAAKGAVEALTKDLGSARELAAEHAKNLDAANTELAAVKQACEALSTENEALKRPARR